MNSRLSLVLPWALIIALLGTSLPAQAREEGAIFLNFGGLLNLNQAQRNEKVFAHHWWVDLAFGYTLFQFFSVGAVYAIDQSKETASGFALSSSNFESREYRVSAGPQIHFWFEPFYLAATYFLNSRLTSERTTDGLSPYQYEGTGSAAELGFLYPLGSFEFSLSIQYRNWKDTTRAQNGGGNTTLSPVREEAQLDPSLKVWWIF